MDPCTAYCLSHAATIMGFWGFGGLGFRVQGCGIWDLEFGFWGFRIIVNACARARARARARGASAAWPARSQGEFGEIA